MNYKRCLIVGLLTVLATTLVYSMLMHLLPHKKPHVPDERRCNNRFELLNQSLPCHNESDLSQEPASFQNKLELIQQEALQKGSVSDVSIYFRSLNDGPWFGTNIDEGFTPASLFKLPIAISIYRAAEHDSGLLMRKVTYDKPFSVQVTQNIPPEKTAELGKTYTISELIEKMLIYSDNASAFLLTDKLKDQVNYDKIYTDLGITVGTADPNNLTLSTKSFATLYRMLYNASYLNKTDSQALLNILVRSREEKTLFSGVPSSVPIAAKFGERGYEDSNIKYLHNCGIIYFPKHPYILCVMTKGTDQTTQGQVIEKVSSTIYQELVNQYQTRY